MEQEKIGKFIKDIRKKNNLTQQQLADKYGVTYQAVSKWENGKNMPDVTLIKQMSKDFNVNIEDILEGNLTPKSKKNNYIKVVIILFAVIVVLLGIIGILFLNRDNTFEFKTLSASCEHFNISGSIAYNSNKSSIYISNINYCGGNDNTEYKMIECILYEKDNNVEKKIDTYNYEEEVPIKLEEFLQDVKFNINNYSNLCGKYQDNSLYLLINATDKDDKIISYKVPLTSKENCSK